MKTQSVILSAAVALLSSGLLAAIPAKATSATLTTKADSVLATQSSTEKIFVGKMPALKAATQGTLIAQASSVQRASVELDLWCNAKNEGGLSGDDEIYVTFSRVLTYRNGVKNAKSFKLWNGSMSTKSTKNKTGNMLVGGYNLAPGDSVTLVGHVWEQDGTNYEPGLKLATQVTAGTVGALFGGAGGAAIGGINVNGIFNQLRSAFSFVNKDDYIGSFSIFIKNEGGQLTWRFDPKGRAQRMPNGTMRLYGDGASYFPLVSINGVRYL